MPALIRSRRCPYSVNAVKNVIGVYRTPLVEVTSKGVYTNTQPVGPYRGAGRPEGNYYMERLMDAAADEIGIDRVELRRRNFIPPEAIPYKAPSGSSYDSGDFAAVLDDALALADLGGYAAREAPERSARQTARSRHRQLSRSDGAARQGNGRHPLRRRRQRHHDQRHARLRPGPRLALRADRGEPARHSVRAASASCKATATSFSFGGGTGGSRIDDGGRHSASDAHATR